MTEEIWRLPAHEIAARVRRRDLRALDVAEAFVNRMTLLDSRYYAYLTATPELAMEQAAAIDERIARGEDVGPLAGVPMALKDNMVTAGVATTAGSKVLRDYIPPYTATVVQRLHQAGAVLLGKTNLDEFAMGSSTENSAYFCTRNPYDTDRVPGGSSGGSAAAVAAGEAAFALGSDTGGSIRQPAAFCGVVGLKPTYGRVSRFGLIAFASSMDQIGPLTRDVRDAALVLQVIAGPDPFDQTASAEAVPDYLAAMDRRELKGMRFAVPVSAMSDAISMENREATERAARLLEGLGMERVELELPNDHLGLDVYYIVAPSEASSNLARYDGIRYGRATEQAEDLLGHYLATRGEGFGEEVKRRIMLGTYALSSGYYDAYYIKAQKVRALIRRDYERAFRDVDIILTPTTPTAAFTIGEKMDDPLTMYMNDILTIPANLAGLPAISVPAGLNRQDLPIGVQMVAAWYGEAQLLAVAAALQDAMPITALPEGGTRGAL